MVVPFFGDQAFWGEMCRRSGVGPAPIAVEKLKVEHLTEGLRFLMQPEVSPSPHFPVLLRVAPWSIFHCIQQPDLPPVETAHAVR